MTKQAGRKTNKAPTLEQSASTLDILAPLLKGPAPRRGRKPKDPDAPVAEPLSMRLNRAVADANRARAELMGLKTANDRAAKHNDHLAKEVIRLSNELGAARQQIAEQLEYIGKADRTVMKTRDDVVIARAEAEAMRRHAFQRAPRFPWEGPQ